jgi:hypothetical protein
MRIYNWKHFPWFVFVCLATIAAWLLYAGNFHPDWMPPGIRLPPSLIQTPTDHHTVGGTPLGLAFGAISLGIFVFAALLNLRKKIPLWRIGTVQLWLRAHIRLTFLTIPLILLHSGFRFGGPMTTLLMALYLHEGAAARRDGLRADSAYLRPALRRRGEDARLVQARAAEEDRGRARRESGENGDGRCRGDGFHERRAKHSGRSR